MSERIDYNSRITLEPGKRSGQPCIRGLRISVTDVLSYFASGMTMEEIIDDFPELSREDFLACIYYVNN
ncbi:DUF433 domain-containing protein [Mucilaginibacter sp.]|uniref:DUF433 domain-containing protein n=1 Tax=Mucilaginibacter sp. TaxID=1882438 RepID=UPI003B000BFF